MIEERRSGRGRSLLGRRLQQSIESVLREQGQVILLLNRRGYSTHMQCPACSHVVQCPDCEIALTYHRADDAVVCHLCDYRNVPPDHCPECRDNNIRYSGSGTQQLEAAVRARFPAERVLRMDTDTMRKKGSHEAALDAFRRGDYSILLGTQMIAKGLDFPNVTLVGVINADVAIHRPDFRAAERTFQLVTQVAGRTGRGDAGGRVIVQTLQPEHIAIVASRDHNFHMLAKHELPMRQVAGYPPYGVLYRLVVRSESHEQAKAFAAEFCQQARQAAEGTSKPLRVIGPADASVPKLRGKFRVHALLLCPEREPLHRAVEIAMVRTPISSAIEYMIDVDPVDMA
jgi:primosomal protein N' (replication factor Y)